MEATGSGSNRHPLLCAKRTGGSYFVPRPACQVFIRGKMAHIQKGVFQEVEGKNVWECYILHLHLPGAPASRWGGILDTTLKPIPPTSTHPWLLESHLTSSPEALKAFPLTPLLSSAFPSTSQLDLVLSTRSLLQSKAPALSTRLRPPSPTFSTKLLPHRSQNGL